MGSVNNNWLGFSLSQNTVHHPHLGFNSVDEISGSTAQISGTESFFNNNLSSADSAIPSLNLPPPFGILEAFNTNTTHSPDWNIKDASMTSLSCSSSRINLDNNQDDRPKLENFLHLNNDNNTYNNICHTSTTTGANGNNNSSSTIGLSMIKNWLRNNPSPPPPHAEENKVGGGEAAARSHTLSLSMSTGSQSSSPLPLLNVNGNAMESCTLSESSKDSQTGGGGAIESVPRKSIGTFGQRTSIYRGVTRHRWTGRYEAHLWDNSSRREGQTRKGRQVYLGGYDKEEKAARAYDLAALKYWGTTTTTNFSVSNYEKEIAEMKHMTRQEYVASLRRKSSGFSRGASIYRGVTRHHQHGRWQARIGRVAGNKDLYLGTFSTQEEAAEAYDIAAIKFRGLSAVTNFETSRYDVKSILESSTLPMGGAAKRLKDAENADNMTLDHLQYRANEAGNLNLHLTVDHHNTCWPTIAFQQAHPLTMCPSYAHQRAMWCKQEQDNHDVNHGFNEKSIYNHQLHSHNFLQPSVLHNNNNSNNNTMGLDSSSMEQYSSASNTIIYYGNSGSGDHTSNGSSSFVVPMTGSTVIVDQDFGSSSTDAYQQATSLYYQSQQSSTGLAKESSLYYDNQGSNWISTAVPTVTAIRSNNNCHGASTVTVWNDTSNPQIQE